MKKSDFWFDLPEELIAQTPLEKRDESSLLVFDRKTKDTYHRTFKDIKSFLKKGMRGISSAVLFRFEGRVRDAQFSCVIYLSLK